ncbi:MAG: hypothetical protein ACRCUY_10000 [Thermoguttaceae bacterium]
MKFILHCFALIDILQNTNSGEKSEKQMARRENLVDCWSLEGFELKLD